jgi:tRNA(fMet)-specific endonuclease VapC
MPGKFLLDTNIVIALFESDPAVLRSLAIADEVFVSSIVLGELFYGAKKSNHPEQNKYV